MNHNNWIKKDRAEILDGFSEVGSIGAKFIKESFEGVKLINVFCRDKGEYEGGKISKQSELILEFNNGKMLGIGNPRYVAACIGFVLLAYRLRNLSLIRGRDSEWRLGIRIREVNRLATLSDLRSPACSALRSCGYDRAARGQSTFLDCRKVRSFGP